MSISFSVPRSGSLPTASKFEVSNVSIEYGSKNNLRINVRTLDAGDVEIDAGLSRSVEKTDTELASELSTVASVTVTAAHIKTAFENLYKTEIDK